MGVERTISVVFVADVPQTGGASACLVELVDALSREWGVRCTVLLSSDGPLVESLNAAGARTYITGHRSFLVSRPGASYKVVPKYLIELVRYLFHRRRALFKANQLIDFDSVDIIHSNLPRNDLGEMLSTMHGIPHVCHLREFSFEDFGCWSYRRRPADYLSTHSSCLLSVSSACGRAWVNRGVEDRKLRVVYDGVDTSAFQGGVPGDERRPRSIVFLGGYSRAKGLDEAIGALRVLKDRGYDNIALDVYGFGGKRDIRRNKGLARRLGVADQVAFHGAVQDVSQVLSTHSIGLVCSRSEAFGRVVIEYLASGLAVVGANRGSIPELLGEGRFGMLYDKGAGSESLADALERLICDDDLVKLFRERGVARAKEFSVKRNARSVMQVYKELLEF